MGIQKGKIIWEFGQLRKKNMGIWSIINKTREIKSAVRQKACSRQLMNAKEVCKLLNANIPEGLDPMLRFSMICCFEGVFLKKSLFVLYEEDSDECGRRAMRQGASAILSSRQIDKYPCIIVPDVLSAVRELLLHVYGKNRMPSTVITGSIGKTTTKNFINCVYSEKFRTFCNVTNGNSFKYLGFELQRLDRRADVLVQEVNESDRCNASYSSLVLKPEIAAITNMDKSHIGELGSEENIMRAISSITDGMDENGIVLLNGDDPNSMKMTFRQRVIRVAIEDRTAECLASNINAQDNAVEFDVEYAGERAHLRIPVGGSHNVYNAMMAYVAGRLNGISQEKIARGLAKYRPLGFRQNVYRAGRNTIYADCYNASARSVKSALGVIDNMKRRPHGKKIAILGDIAEIEGYEQTIYREIGERVSASDLDVLITYGKDSKMIHDSLCKQGLRAIHAETGEQLCSYVRENQTGRDILLFKASRSMGLEQAIQELFPAAYVKGMLPVWRAYMKWTMKTL